MPRAGGAPAGEDRLWHLEGLMPPKQLLARALDLLLAERRTVGRGGAGLRRRAIADDGPAGDQRWPVCDGPRFLDSQGDSFRIVAVTRAVCQPEALKRSIWSSETARLVGPSIDI